MIECENLEYDGEISTYIPPQTIKVAFDEVEDSSSMYPQTSTFDSLLEHALSMSDEDTSDWENLEFLSAISFDKRKRSWG